MAMAGTRPSRRDSVCLRDAVAWRAELHEARAEDPDAEANRLEGLVEDGDHTEATLDSRRKKFQTLEKQ